MCAGMGCTGGMGCLLVYVVRTRLLGAWGMCKDGVPWEDWACVGFGCTWRWSRVGAIRGRMSAESEHVEGTGQACGWCTLGAGVWDQGALR